jgi:hypothetical protein
MQVCMGILLPQRGTPGMRDPMQTVPLPLPCEEPPDRCRTHLEEETPCLLLHLEMPMGGEVLRGGGMPPASWTGPRNVLAAQIVMSACCTRGPYRGGLCRWICFVESATRMVSPRRERCPAWCRTRAAYLLQYPMDSQKLSSIADFLVFPAFQYACVFTIVSFLRS